MLQTIKIPTFSINALGVVTLLLTIAVVLAIIVCSVMIEKDQLDLSAKEKMIAH